MGWHCKASGGYDRNSDEAYDNCVEIYRILTGRGWSLNAICGVLGNIESESSYNPWRWQGDNIMSVDNPIAWDSTLLNTGRAYGLCQWDGPGKYIVGGEDYAGWGPNFVDQEGSQLDGQAQMYFLDEHADYIPSASYPETYSEYKQLTESASYCARAWFSNFERGTWDDGRMIAAEFWYVVLSETPPGERLPLWLLFKMKLFNNFGRRFY